MKKFTTKEWCRLRDIDPTKEYAYRAYLNSEKQWTEAEWEFYDEIARDAREE